MVKRAVWEQAWPGTSQKSANKPMPLKLFLCIACLEKRLGRRLSRRDFDLRRKKINDPERKIYSSRILRNRLR